MSVFRRLLAIIGLLATHLATPAIVDDATRDACGRDYTLFVVITATTNVSKAHLDNLSIDIFGRNPCVVIAHSTTAFIEDIGKAKSNPQGWAGAAAIVVVEPDAVVLAEMMKSLDLSHLCTSSDAIGNSSSVEMDDDELGMDVSERKLAGKVKNTHVKKSRIKRQKHVSHSAPSALFHGGIAAAPAQLTRLRIVVVDREPLFEVLESLTTQSHVLRTAIFGMDLRRKMEYVHESYGQIRDIFIRSSSCVAPESGRKHSTGRSRSSGRLQSFENSVTSTTNSSVFEIEAQEVLHLTFCESFCLQDHFHRLKHRVIAFIGLLKAHFSSIATLHATTTSVETDDYNAEVMLQDDKNESTNSYSQCFSMGYDNRTIRSIFPALGMAPFNSDSFEHLYSHWETLLNFSSECSSSYTPLAEQEEHNSWWTDGISRGEALNGLEYNGDSLSWVGPGELTVAVLILGTYRVFDGTWPSHQRFIYDPIRLDPSTKYLDIFTCTETHKVPAGMLKPTASFVAPPTSNMFQRFDHCFRNVEKWAKEHWNTTVYDFYMRIRPDMEFAYALPWPLPSRGSPMYGDVQSSIYLGNIRTYSWADNVTLAMIGRGKPFAELLHTNGNCPIKKNNIVMAHPRLNDPCVDIGDQIAIIRGHRVAEQYFCLNLSHIESRIEQMRDSRPTSSDQRKYQCSAMWHTWANEAVVSHRVLANAKATIAPYDLGGYFLAPMRKEPMSCTNKITGSLRSCTSKKWLSKLNMAYYDSLKARGAKLNCIFGKQASLLERNETHEIDNASVADLN